VPRTHRARRGSRDSEFVAPVFPSGVVSEPRLLFGGGHQHVDPKAGLGVYGPYSLVGQTSPSLTSITIGIVTTGQLLTAARAWLKRCQQLVTNDGSQPFLFPAFPGMTPSSPFGCELVFGPTWEEQISEKELVLALGTIDYHRRLAAVVKVFASRVQNLSERSPRPDVILCAIPKDVIAVCTVDESFGERRRPKLTQPKRRREFNVMRGNSLSCRLLLATRRTRGSVIAIFDELSRPRRWSFRFLRKSFGSQRLQVESRLLKRGRCRTRQLALGISVRVCTTRREATPGDWRTCHRTRAT
jgi:hypothetical protein